MCFNNHQMSAPVVGGPEVNKFDQVSSDGQQMSLAGGQGWGRRRAVQLGPWGRGGAGLGPCTVRFHVQRGGGCTVRSNASWVRSHGSSLVKRLRDMTGNITFPQFRWRAVKTMNKFYACRGIFAPQQKPDDHSSVYVEK